MDIDKYKKALSELAKMHEHITGEKLSIECETSQGRRQLAKLVFANVEGTSENYRLHSCFDLEGVWFTVNTSGFYDEKCLELKAQQERIEELEEQIRSLQHMERTALAWFQCQLDYAVHDGEKMPYSASYSKLIEDKIFNEHALKECLKARQALKEKADE